MRILEVSVAGRGRGVKMERRREGGSPGPIGHFGVGKGDRFSNNENRIH